MSSLEAVNTLDYTRRRSVSVTLWALLLAGAAAWAVMYVTGERHRLWQSLLINFLYFTPLSAGMVVWSAVVNLSHGRWAGPAEKPALWGLGGAVVSLVLFAAVALLFVPSWSGLYENPVWGIWQGGQRDFNKGIWLNTTFLLARDGVGLLLFWLVAIAYFLRRMRGHEAMRTGVILVLAYTGSMSLIGYDMVMGLDPYWYSSLLAPYYFISGMYIAVGAWAFTVTSTRFVLEPDRRHDIGNLIVTFSILTTYMMYAQLLCIWYGNLPNEIRFLLPRFTERPWMLVSIFLLFTAYMGPLVLMLPRWVKRNPTPLMIMALWVLLSMWIERWWLVVPTFHEGDKGPIPLDLQIGDIAVAVACAAGVALGISYLSRAFPGRLPVGGEAHE